MDLDSVWAYCEQQAAATVNTRPGLPLPEHPVAQTVLFALGIPAQVMVERDDLGGPSFQLHPNPECASAKSWVWLIQARDGASTEMFQRFYGTKLHSVYQEYRVWCDETDGAEATFNALSVCPMVDLVAVSPKLTKTFGTMCGASVLGWPQHPEIAESPVRVFRTVKTWMENLCRGVVLLGTPADNLDWLRRCAAGIVCEDIAHGQAVQKALRRPYDGPSVMVAQ